MLDAWSLEHSGASKLLRWAGAAAHQLSTLRLHIQTAQHRAISLRGLALRRMVLGKTELPSIGEAWEVAPAPGGTELAFSGRWCRAELAAFEEDRPPEQQEELCRALGMSMDELRRRAPSNVAAAGTQDASAKRPAKSTDPPRNVSGEVRRTSSNQQPPVRL